MQRIKGYHAHIYFDASTIEQARTLCEDAAKLFPLRMGRVHERPVGPHPDWSCQLAFASLPSRLHSRCDPSGHRQYWGAGTLRVHRDGSPTGL